MNGKKTPAMHLSMESCEKDRIYTQIHRRRKVKAFSPLELEWESSGEVDKAKELRLVMPNCEVAIKA